MIKQTTLEKNLKETNNKQTINNNLGVDTMEIKETNNNNKEFELKTNKELINDKIKTMKGVDNMDYKNMETKELKKELVKSLKILEKNENNAFLNKRALKSNIKSIKREIYLKCIFDSNLNADMIYNSFNNAYKNKLINKTILEKNIKELYFIKFKESLSSNDKNKIIPLNTVNHGAIQHNRAFIVETTTSIKLYSYNNLILDYRQNKDNNTLYVATNTISTPNSPYDLNGSYSTSTNYNSFDKDNNSINLTLLLSVTTTQHINAFMLHIKELNKFKTNNKGATAFIRSLTDNLTLKEFKELKKTNDRNKLVKLATFNKKENRWSFEQFKQ